MAKEVVTAIDINAPAERVWQILTDFDEYPAWNPFIRSISGTLEPGARLRVTLQPPRGRSVIMKPRWTVIKPQQELRWLGHLVVPGIFDGEHAFVIQSAGIGRVTFIHRERFSGVLVRPLWQWLDREIRGGFEGMNEALRGRAERGS